jgi:hypothetical protein
MIEHEPKKGRRRQFCSVACSESRGPFCQCGKPAKKGMCVECKKAALRSNPPLCKCGKPRVRSGGKWNRTCGSDWCIKADARKAVKAGRQKKASVVVMCRFCGSCKSMPFHKTTENCKSRNTYGKQRMDFFCDADCYSSYKQLYKVCVRLDAETQAAKERQKLEAHEKANAIKAEREKSLWKCCCWCDRPFMAKYHWKLTCSEVCRKKESLF